MKKMHEIFPSGCSSKQLDKLRDSWFEKYGNPYTEGADWSEVKHLDRMYDALDMLSSCYAYNGIPYFYDKYYDKYLEDYIKVGGNKEDFDKMLNIQCEHYKRCSVKSNVYTDYEGCSYNSIVEEDEVCNM